MPERKLECTDINSPDLSRLLRGQKVWLRCVQHSDLAARTEWINDPRVQQTLSFDFPTSYERTQAWFNRAILDSTRRDFSIIEAATGRYIGFAGLLNIDHRASKAEVYVTIGQVSSWGKGYGSEAYALLAEFGFSEVGLNRLYAYQLAHNTGSLRAVEKAGFRIEGRLRQDVFSHGALRDRYITAILRDEWLAARGEK